jgi:HlyD family secretion protein
MNSPLTTEKTPDLNRERPRKRPVILLGSLLIVAGIGAMFWWSQRSSQAPPTQAVTRQTLREIIDVSGVVMSEQEVQLKATISGTVTARLVPENQAVKSGQTLLRIDPNSYQLQLEQANVNAQANLRQAETEVTNARQALTEAEKNKGLNVRNLQLQADRVRNQVTYLTQELARNRSLLDQEAIPRQTYDNQKQQLEQAQIELKSALEAISRTRRNETEIVTARTRLTQAQTALTNARKQGPANVAVARDSVIKTTVAAPFNGTITAWNVNRGDYVTPGTNLGRFIDLTSLRLRLAVNELDVPKIKASNPVEIVFDAYPDTPYKGQVSWISEASITEADNVQIFPVKLTFANPDRRIKPGMSGDARITVQEKTNVVAIPIAAVRKSGKNFVVDIWDGKAKQEVVVEPGINTDTLLEIRKGLKPGDQLIVDTPTDPPKP